MSAFLWWKEKNHRRGTPYLRYGMAYDEPLPGSMHACPRCGLVLELVAGPGWAWCISCGTPLETTSA